MDIWSGRDNEYNMDSNLGNTGNHEKEQNRMEEKRMEQNNQLGQNTSLSQGGNTESTENSVSTNAVGTGAEASGSIYSYSYRNQEHNPNYYENQEHNPNYYENQEQQAANQRTYTAGVYGMSQTEGQGNTGNSESQGFSASAAYTDAGNTGYAENQSDTQDTTDTQGPKGVQASKKEKNKKKHSGTKKPHGFGMALAKCAGLAVVFGLVSSTVFYGTGIAFQHTAGVNQSNLEMSASSGKGKVTVNNGNLSATNVSTATTVTDVSDIVENVMPSIVSITNMAQIVDRDFFGRYYQQETPNAGSGIIIGQTEEEIYIATNNHVVANSNQLTVNFVDDQQVEGEIKGTDPSTDLAVISVKVKDIPSDTMEKIKVATVGDSDNVKVGQSVVAIGNALGYGQSVTTGVVSALNREVTLQDETTGETITNDLLQTDAAINPGNSGGALLNMNGELVGINSAKYSDTQVEGMGYAIPISAAEPIINDLITREVVDESNSAFLGVSGQDVTGDLSESFGMPEGLYITMVTENSAAQQAGIKKGDVLTEFDGRAVKSMESLMDIMQYYAAGTEVEITLQVYENGEWKEQKITATLGRKNN